MGCGIFSTYFDFKFLLCIFKFIPNNSVYPNQMSKALTNAGRDRGRRPSRGWQAKRAWVSSSRTINLVQWVNKHSLN